jgi:SulP family sulfate permease
MGDLYFGAVGHIEDSIFQLKASHPEQYYLLLRMHHVSQCDFTGIHMLENVLRAYREDGGDLYLMEVQDSVLAFMDSTGFIKHLGQDHFLNKDDAISFFFYKILDPVVCIYECPVKVFKECQNLPKPAYTLDIPTHPASMPDKFPMIQPQTLWEAIHSDQKLFVIDLREPMEFRRGHIVEAKMLPLPQLFSKTLTLPKNQPIILVCRTNRRSERAAVWLEQQGFKNILILKGGMRGWENAGYLTAVELNLDEQVME